MPAHADKFYVKHPSEKEQTLRQLWSGQGWAQEDIDRALFPTREMMPMLIDRLGANALKEDYYGTYFQANLIGYEIGPRQGDWKDPANHDLLAIASQDGGSAILVPSNLVLFVFYELDTEEDFKWLFSDWHERAGVQFGGPAHRDYLISLADPANEIGLAEGPPPESVEAVMDGTFTKLIFEGDAFIRDVDYRWEKNQPVGAFGLGWERRWGDGINLTHSPGMSGYDLFVGAARERIRNGPETPFYRAAIRAIGMLCGLRRIEPDFITVPSAELNARYARWLGDGCLAAVNGALNAREVFDAAPPSEMIRSAELLRQEPPITQADLRMVAFDAIAIEPSLRMVVGLNPILPTSLLRAPPSRDWAPLHRFQEVYGKFGIQSVLINPLGDSELASFSSPRIGPAHYLWQMYSGKMPARGDVTAKAEKILKLLAYGRADDPPDLAFLLEPDQRYIRAALLRELTHPFDEREHLVAVRLLCENGWSSSADMLDFADVILLFDGRELPLLALIIATTGDGLSADGQVAGRLRTAIAQLRARVEYEENLDKPPIRGLKGFREYLDEYDRYSEMALNCENYPAIAASIEP
jgi:hypothetical protein